MIDKTAAALEGKIRIGASSRSKRSLLLVLRWCVLVALGIIDSTVEKELVKRYGVKGYPTVKFRRDGMAVAPHPVLKAYKGKKTLEAFQAFSDRMHGESMAQTLLLHCCAQPTHARSSLHSCARQRCQGRAGLQ